MLDWLAAGKLDLAKCVPASYSPQDIQEAVSENRVDFKKILGIGITNQRESTILWERDSGKPLYNSICWQCRRSAAICDQLKSAGCEPAIV